MRVRRTKGDVVISNKKTLCKKKDTTSTIGNIFDCYWKKEDAGNFTSKDMGRGGCSLYFDYY